MSTDGSKQEEMRSSDPQPPSHRKPKFEVKESKPAYRPNRRALPRDISIRHQRADYRSEQNTRHSFYIKASAFEAIQSHIGWNNQTIDNVVEQGGILLGNSFIDTQTSVIHGVVEQIVSARLTEGTSSYLQISQETWKKMLDDVDRLHTGLQVIGWYHTHPNSLDVFMSKTDKATQTMLFGNDWQFALVLNPHRMIWRAFCGARAIDCPGYVIKDSCNYSG